VKVKIEISVTVVGLVLSLCMTYITVFFSKTLCVAKKRKGITSLGNEICWFLYDTLGSWSKNSDGCTAH